MMADFNYIITFVLDVEFLEVDVVKEISVTTPYHSVSLSFKPPVKNNWNTTTTIRSMFRWMKALLTIRN